MMNAGRRRGSEKVYEGKEDDSAGAGIIEKWSGMKGLGGGRAIRVVRDEKFEAM